MFDPTSRISPYLSSFNEDLGGWDMSNAINLDRMFYSVAAIGNRGSFVGNGLDKWKITASVRSMREMFYGQDVFNRYLGDWDVSNVVDMTRTFRGCGAFAGGGLDQWDVGNVETLHETFRDAFNFKADAWVTVWHGFA